MLSPTGPERSLHHRDIFHRPPEVPSTASFCLTQPWPPPPCALLPDSLLPFQYWFPHSACIHSWCPPSLLPDGLHPYPLTCLQGQLPDISRIFFTWAPLLFRASLIIPPDLLTQFFVCCSGAMSRDSYPGSKRNPYVTGRLFLVSIIFIILALRRRRWTCWMSCSEQTTLYGYAYCFALLVWGVLNHLYRKESL